MTIRITEFWPNLHYTSLPLIQWSSGKFSIVGTLAWPYGHIPFHLYRYRWRGGGAHGARINACYLQGEYNNHVQTGGYNSLDNGGGGAFYYIRLAFSYGE